jgi:DNA-binding NarL/FixJ family response regulator
MSYKVLIYSSHPIVEVGLSFCIKKSIPGATVSKTNSLDLFTSTESFLNCDLFVFDIFCFEELNFIKEQLISYFKEKKIVFFTENFEIKKNQDLKNAIYIYKNSTELEIVKSIKAFCKIRKPTLRYKSVTKNIQIKNQFSEREKQCANLLMKGYSMSQISKELALKKNTISTYKIRMHKKTNTKNLVQLLKTLYSLKD